MFNWVEIIFKSIFVIRIYEYLIILLKKIYIYNVCMNVLLYDLPHNWKIKWFIINSKKKLIKTNKKYISKIWWKGNSYWNKNKNIF